MFKTLLHKSAVLFAASLGLSGIASAQYGNAPSEAAIILFSGDNFQGEPREVFEPISDLPDLRFNDKARSVAILEGAWEMCEHSNFTGRCVFVREDVQDLRVFNMNKNISSVRPIYEVTDAAHGLMFVRQKDGNIRYADQSFNQYANQNNGYRYDNHAYGYNNQTRLDIRHYGYSQDYNRYGYYNPHAGFGPYGFGYSGYGLASRYNRTGYRSRYGAFGRHGHQGYRAERRPLRGHYGAENGAVTLYTDSRRRGASLGLNRGVRDLSRYRFNDSVSSIDIREGRWEVCSDSNFRGRCEIIDASTGRLNNLRLNDNISSLRPVPGSYTPPNRRDRTDRRRGAGNERANGAAVIDRPRRRGVNVDRPNRRGVTRPDRRPRVDRPRRDGLAGGPVSRRDRPARPARRDRPRVARPTRDVAPAPRPRRAERPRPQARPQARQKARPRPQPRRNKAMNRDRAQID